MYYFILVVIIFAIIIFILNFKNKIELNNNDKDEKEKFFKLKPYFFSKSEIMFFNILNELNQNKFVILSKVRLEDIVSVNKEIEWDKRKGKRGYIKSKHLDFVLIDKNKIISVIELDGKSHTYEKQKKSDLIKDEILNSVGVKFYRIKVGEDFREKIKLILSELENLN